MEIKFRQFIEHETKKYQLKRFLIALLVFVGYTIFLVFSYGSGGLALGVITWSAFVMATPLPDGGILLDLPIRVLTGVRMIISEIFVWIVAISSNLYFLAKNPDLYGKTVITSSFKQVLTSPWPNWIIILISCLGTFLGLYFGDELLDAMFHRERKKYAKLKSVYRLIFALFAVFVLYFSYRYFLEIFGINI